MPQSTPFLRGKRVNLHVIEESDAPQILKWLNDEEVRDFILHFLPFSQAEEVEWINKAKERKATDLTFALVTTDGKYIGNMGLHQMNMQHRTAMTGAVIGERDFRGQGLGTEAKMVLLNYAFNTLNLRKIYSRALATNPRSLRYSEKCGYQREGLLRQDVYKNGQYLDIHLLAVFKEDWLPLWEKFRNENGL